jgi:hypothetical protein
MISKFDAKKYRKEVEKDNLQFLMYLLDEETKFDGEVEASSKVIVWKSKIFLSKFINN